MDARGHLPWRRPGGVHAQVGDGGVERIPFPGQLLQAGRGVVALQQGAGGIPGEPGHLFGRGGVQVDDEGALREQGAAGGVEHGAAPRGHQQSGALEQALERRGFEFAEGGFAGVPENGGHRCTGDALDLGIHVHALQPGPSGQDRGDAALAGPHGAYQGEVGGGLHPAILASPASSRSGYTRFTVRLRGSVVPGRDAAATPEGEPQWP